MLGSALIVTTVAVSDLEASGRFFEEQVGLPLLETTPFAWRFGGTGGGQLSIRRGTPNSGNTVAHFEVDDIDAEIRDLRARGVPFQEYETPKTIDFIAQIGPARAAWFTDPDGNVFGLREGPVPGRD